MIKKTARLIICILIFFLSLPAVFAKTSDTFALFEVLIQKFNDETSLYEDFYSLRAKGDVKKVDIAADLEVGKYRYRIKQEDSDIDYSDWFYFEIENPSTKESEPAEIKLNLGYICPVILFDSVIPDYMGKRIWPLSGSVNFELLPARTSAGNIGFGLKFFYSRMEKQYSGYKISGNLVSAYLDLVWEIPLTTIFALDLHAGAGGILFNNFEVSYNAQIDSGNKLNSLNLSFDTGLSLNVFFTKHFFLSAGTDFTYSILSDMVVGQIIPEISFGLRF